MARLALRSLLLLALALGVAFVAGRREMARRETVAAPGDPWGPDTRLLDTRSGRTHVLDVGAGPVILLAHGSGRSVADWLEGLAAKLAEGGRRVVAYDDYGFGLSDRDHGWSYGNALWERQAVDVLDALGIERAVIAGHSAGGVVAATLAADHPERIRGAVFLGHGLAVDPTQWIALVPGAGELVYGRVDVYGDTFSEAHRRRQLEAYRVRGTRAALLTFVRRQYTIDGLRLVTGTYEDISVPVLQIHGSEDASIPVDAARGLTPRLRDARFVLVEGASHDVHVDAPERVASEILAFEAGLAP
ncbi:MAG TPA: alpha/beta hydrolase [Myxococcota bacterium]|nr:alpha/beta hydrolase [Myxococcota bacterium]